MNWTKMLLAAVVAVIFAVGCAACGSEPAVKEKSSWLLEHESEIINYAYTKEGIEAEIEAHWQEYGYSVKPDKYIAITFDDGPCDPSANGGTAGMLAKLEELHVKATFFVIGENIRNNMDAASAIFNAGHELGNHSYGWIPLGNVDKESIITSLDDTSQAIREITGKYPSLFRAPNGDYGTNLLRVCLERGMPLIGGTPHNDWDGTGHTPASIRNSILRHPRDGGIIALHENNTSKGDTMEALPEIIGGLREKGFWILTVGQLAVIKDKTLRAGTIYNSIR
jgi:peptidoglycan/xylan/chitin deacetylase (PgdA/CDA1 family)